MYQTRNITFNTLRYKKAKYYSTLFDETTYVSNISQMYLIIRYELDDIIYERFLTFIDCHNYNYNKNKDHNENKSNHTLEPKITGEILDDTVIKFLQELKLNFDYCVGI